MSKAIAADANTIAATSSCIADRVADLTAQGALLASLPSFDNPRVVEMIDAVVKRGAELLAMPNDDQGKPSACVEYIRLLGKAMLEIDQALTSS